MILQQLPLLSDNHKTKNNDDNNDNNNKKRDNTRHLLKLAQALYRYNRDNDDNKEIQNNNNNKNTRHLLQLAPAVHHDENDDNYDNKKQAKKEEAVVLPRPPSTPDGNSNDTKVTLASSCVERQLVAPRREEEEGRNVIGIDYHPGASTHYFVDLGGALKLC